VRLAHLDLGIVLAKRNASGEAALHFHEAIRIDSSKPDAHYRLGRLLHSLGREQEANAEFAKVKELAKDQQEPLIKISGKPVSGKPGDPAQ